jgi:hypothetical protein
LSFSSQWAILPLPVPPNNAFIVFQLRDSISLVYTWCNLRFFPLADFELEYKDELMPEEAQNYLSLEG